MSDSELMLTANGAEPPPSASDLAVEQLAPDVLVPLVLSALAAAPLGVLVFDADDRLVLFNERARALLAGLQVRLATGVALAQIFPDWPRREDDATLAGQDRWWSPEDGRAVGLTLHAMADGGRLIMAIDETGAQGSEQRLADVIEAAEVGTWDWDLTTGRNRVNDRWLGMLGYSRADLEPVTIDTWQCLIHPGDRATVAKVVNDMIGRQAANLEHTFRLRHADGQYIWVQSRGRVTRWSPNGLPELMAGVHIDVTALRAAERRLDDFERGARFATWQYDTRTGTNLIDRSWAEMIGYTLEELQPMSAEQWEALVHPADFAALVEKEAQQFAAGIWEFDTELRMRHRAGHWVWILAYERVTDWDEDGVPIMTSGLHIDISARKELEAALEKERNFLAALMETSISGIVAMDAGGRIIFANTEAEAVLGWPLGSLIGLTCKAADWQMTDTEGRPLDASQIPFVIAATTGQTQLGHRINFVRPDGQRRTLSVNAAPLRLAGIAADVVCSLTDITEAVQAEANLRQAMERAEAGNRAKSAFLANMSHELRTPLNGVLGMAEVLGATLTTPEQKSMLATMQSSGSLLLAIINDILDLARIESGKIQLEHQPFVPADLAQRVETLHGLTAQAKGVDLILLTDFGATRPRVGDAPRVLQILHNLVGNAVKFTEAGSVKITVTARITGPLVLEVADTGIGMTPDQVSRVFDDFAQADSTITRRFGGTGLGLPIVRRLIGLMGGQITLDSQPGIGSTVRVELPLPVAEEPPPMATLPAAKWSFPPGLAQVRVLVAEDNATNRLILQSMLAAMGVSATLVDDGDAAVDLWQPGQFDALLLDISMPRKDGVAALAAIRARAAALGAVCPPALAVTANAMTHQFDEYRSLGFADCVAKPIRIEDLAQAIHRAVLG